MVEEAGQSRPLRTHRAAIVKSGEVTVLARPEVGRHVALNPTARALWELCDGETTVNEMIGAICSLFDVTTEQATSDVQAALDQMRDAGVIQ